MAPGRAGVFRALAPRGAGPPRRASSWCRGGPTRSVRHARGAVDDPGGGAPAPRRPSPNRAGWADPTRRASPHPAPVTLALARPAVRRRPGGGARPGPRPGAETSGQRAEPDRAAPPRPSPPPPDRERLAPGGSPMAVYPYGGGPCWGKLLESKTIPSAGSPNRSATGPTHPGSNGR